MKYYINTQGITNNKPEQNNLPNREEVDFCKEVLSFIQEGNKFVNSSSYGYKHVLEKAFQRHYLTNGSFIQAAQELDLSIQREDIKSPNAYFKFNSDDLNLALFKYLNKDYQISIDSSNIDLIKKYLIKSYTKSGKTTLGTIHSYFQSFTTLDFPLKDLIHIIQTTALNLKYKFNQEDSNIDSLGLNFTVNISKSKLNNLLVNN